MHFECTDFNSSTRVTVYAECINLVLVSEYHVDCRHGGVVFALSDCFLSRFSFALLL